MRIEHITIQGCNEWNEDALILNESQRIYGVLDGATSVTDFTGRGGETGGYLASQTTKAYLESLDDSNAPATLREAVLEANRRIRGHMLEYGIDVDNNQEVWAAGIAVVRVGERQIEYAQTGDCMIVAVYKDGTVRTVTHDQVDHFDEKSRLMWEQYAKQGLSREEVRKHVFKAILNNRLKTNTEEGYAILNGDPKLEHYVENGMINRIQLKSVLIISDGLFLPRKAGDPARPMSEMIDALNEKGLAGYADWLIAAEYDESQNDKYTRLKISDDKTAVWIHFD